MQNLNKKNFLLITGGTGGHVIPANFNTTFSYGGAGTYSSSIFSMSNTGGGQSHENRPPYYALCYIMKT